MTTHYKYFGILLDSATPHNPSGVIRVWTGPDGRQMEETFTISLTWERSHEFSPMARPDYYEIVEIDESVVGPFMERVKEIHGTP
jgi:hypothetical protein